MLPRDFPPACRRRCAQIDLELATIALLFARGKGILCQGRGSAANSAVCYCLYVTEVDPARMNVLFEGFISVERSEPPDIDVDIEHQRREEVMQYIYAKYGRHRAVDCSPIGVCPLSLPLCAKRCVGQEHRRTPGLCKRLSAVAPVVAKGRRVAARVARCRG